ncbi:MAG: gliding motility-associated C-terminal domain-containing protein [Bacteroidetes bacterium]|nr:gliding motility-associated C-terminal domain-containing protein [Bacteroidota bacterium]
MKKKILLPLLIAVIGISIPSFSQQKSVINNPDVPGASGYPGTNSSIARNTNGNPTPQNGSGTLGNYYSLTKCGLNYATASQVLGQRLPQPGVPQPAPFTISGVPVGPCVTIEKALLYCDASGNGAAMTATVNGPLGSANYPMSIIGSGADKCWGYSGSYSYRADVTASVNGNGTYNVSGLLTSPPSSGNDVDGATLIVVWSDGSQSYQGTIQLDDGCIEVSGGVANYNMTYPAICGAPTNGQAFFCVGDIQMNPSSWSANSTSCPLIYSWWNYVTTASTYAVSQTTSNFNVNSSGDCFNLLMAGVYYQTTCLACVSSSLVLATASTGATCSACNGTATVNVTSGSGPFTYSWSPSGGTGATATSLCAGTYTVAVNSPCGTTTTTIVVPVIPSTLAVSSLSQTNVSCNIGCDGTAAVSVTGGTAPFIYAWTPSGGNASSATGLCLGSYTCTVTDASACTQTHVFAITQPNSLITTASQTNATCNSGCDGTATCTVTGGTPGYTYSWAPSGGTAATASGLCFGTYTCTVVDANNCTTTQTFSITQSTALIATPSQGTISCNGGTTTASVVAAGGTGPYTYAWTPSGGTGATTTAIVTGSYTCTITDSHGCTTTQSFLITQPTVLTSTSSQGTISCNGGTTTASVVGTGGTGPYTYSWTPAGGTGATSTAIIAGTYTCTITDFHGCITTQSFTITQPTAVGATSTHGTIACNGGTSTASVTASGGTGPYAYTWTPSGGTGSTSAAIAAGTYTCTITDSHGCITTQTVTLTQPSALVATTVGDSACLGSSTQISANASGGVGPYTYAWSNGPTGQSQIVTLNTSTNFTVTITDAHGCTTTGTSSFTVNPIPVAAITSNSNNGIYVYSPSTQLCFYGPTVGITTWNWTLQSGTSNVQDPCVNILPSDTGSFCAQLIVQNIHGCSDTANTCVEILDISFSIPNVFTPNGDNNNDAFVITNVGMKTLHCMIYDRWGVLVYEWNSPLGYWDGMTKSGQQAVDGVYYWTLEMSDYAGKNYDNHGFVHLIRGK